MTTNSIPSSDKLPPKSLNEDTQADELPETNLDDRRAPPISMGNSRTAGESLTGAEPKTGRTDPKDRLPAPQTANRE